MRMIRTLCLFVFALVGLESQAQQTYIREIDDSTSGVWVRTLATPDGGYVIYTADSNKVYKFSSCGDLQWCRKYQVAFSQYACDFISVRGGGFAMLTRTPLNADDWASLITRIDTAGNVLWSKTIEDGYFSQYSYTISEDATGNFFLFANVMHAFTNPFYNMLCKISPTGTILWTRMYDHGWVWGGAIVTADQGVLFRSGNTFIKTDYLGNLQWTSDVYTGTYFYYAALEVSDGYIFSGYDNSGHDITLFKISKQGLLLIGKRTLNYVGTPPFLRKKSNGNFAWVLNKFIGTQTFVTVMEFDKDLNLVAQNSIKYTGSGELTGKDICFLGSGNPIVTGIVVRNNKVNLFHSKMDLHYQTGCDTLLDFIANDFPVQQQFKVTNEFPFSTMITAARSVPADTFTVSQQTLCSNFSQLTIDLGNDTAVCEHSTLLLSNHTPGIFEHYQWSTGSTQPVISVTHPGTYILNGIYDCGNASVTDTIVITEQVIPDPPFVKDTSICSADPIVLQATIPGASYHWQDGFTGSEYIVTRPGTYFVNIELNGCIKKLTSEVTDCKGIQMPNVFTPDGDGKNDRFIPIRFDGIVSALLTVYNRWGEEIYKTHDLLFGWPGDADKQSATDGVYYWTLTYIDYLEQTGVLTGTVQLISN